MEVVKGRRNNSENSRVLAISFFNERVLKMSVIELVLKYYIRGSIKKNLLSRLSLTFYELKTFFK